MLDMQMKENRSTASPVDCPKPEGKSTAAGPVGVGPFHRWVLRWRAKGRLRSRLAHEWEMFRLRRAKRRHRAGHPPPTVKTVAFLVGCQRSGTDMCLEVLGRSMDTDVFNEDDRAAFSRCRLRERALVLRLVERSDAPVIVFKPICDSHRTVELLGWHAPSRAIWLYRDFRDVARSTVAKWGDANLRHLRDLLGGGGEWGWSQWNREGYDAEALAEVAPLVDEKTTPHDAAAMYWYLRNRCYFSQKLDERDDVRLFRYRDLVTRPHETFARMCAFLGLRYDETMARSIHARSLARGKSMALSAGVERLCTTMMDRLDAACAEDERTPPP
ncbi:MAG: hypothetical protein D6788_11055 [Planctomycetota bacterium]|nr:MAG: hypothetical protein D6788_11055 [Planctomycetota bacterium]